MGIAALDPPYAMSACAMEDDVQIHMPAGRGKGFYV